MTIQVSEKVKEYAEKYEYVLKGNKGTEKLIPILREIQVKEHYLPEHAIIAVSVALNVPLAEVYGVATFYNFFKLEKQGAFVFAICEGTACHINGAPKILSAFKNKLGIGPGQMTSDGKFSLEIVRCLGMCASAPVILVNGKVHTKVSEEEVVRIIDSCKNG